MAHEHQTTDDISQDELVLRVVHALLRPAVQIGGVFGVSVKELTRLLESAYFQDQRARTATLRETATRLGISERSAERLSKQARETFLLPELKHHLPRRIEFMLAATPMSSARIAQVLRDVEEADIANALNGLVEAGRIKLDGDRTAVYEPVEGVRSMERDSWVGRVGGLASFAENLANAAWGRFFNQESAAFARTLTFRLTPERVQQLTAWYSEQVLPHIVQWSAEADAAGVDDTTAMQMSLCWAPYEAISQANPTQANTATTEGESE
jgi:hypothetical protein